MSHKKWVIPIRGALYNSSYYYAMTTYLLSVLDYLNQTRVLVSYGKLNQFFR